ncbi:MAG: CocE/NonD family hydrolase [Woeseiaceae bacterium]
MNRQNPHGRREIHYLTSGSNDPLFITLISVALCCLSLVSNAPAGELPSYDIQAHYNKAEHMIPMRDGVKLFTAVYSPNDVSKVYPILLFRTPYSIEAYGEDFPDVALMAPSIDFLKEGYIFVLQDMRGTFRSEGTFEVIRAIRENKKDSATIDESTDAYDTIDWLIRNVDGHNGKVGQWGISYPGWATVMGMVDSHPALVASSPQASPSDMFIGDDWHHNGAFRLMYSFDWMGRSAQRRNEPTTEKPRPFDYGTPWGYEFFLNAGPTYKLNDKYFGGGIPAWSDFVIHPNYDEFWQQQSALPHMKNIEHAILNVAGWFDAEDFYGPISIYKEIEKTTPENESILVVGPWSHGGWSKYDGSFLGDIQFGSRTSDFYKKCIVFPFFEYHLKGKGSWNNPSEAIVFETGNNRWHELAQWPPNPSEVKNLYFQEHGKLSFEVPKSRSMMAMDRYTSDPQHPVPYSREIRATAGDLWMIEDQRLIATRPDVLTYQTDVLEDEITIAGPIKASLFLSTTGTDADFFVKLIDVYPGDAPDNDLNDVSMGGYQMLVGVEVMRAKYRDSMSAPKSLQPGEITPISFIIWDRFHTFKKGHRIMVQIHSSWFPAYDRNPQQFMNIYRAEEGDYIPADHSIYRSRNFPSHLELPVVEDLVPRVGSSSPNFRAGHPGCGGVAPPLHIPDMRGRRALPAGRRTPGLRQRTSDSGH